MGGRYSAKENLNRNATKASSPPQKLVLPVWRPAAPAPEWQAVRSPCRESSFCPCRRPFPGHKVTVSVACIIFPTPAPSGLQSLWASRKSGCCDLLSRHVARMLEHQAYMARAMSHTNGQGARASTLTRRVSSITEYCIFIITISLWVWRSPLFFKTKFHLPWE